MSREEPKALRAWGLHCSTSIPWHIHSAQETYSCTSLLSTGIQRPSQQSAATQDYAHSMPVAVPLGKKDPELPLPSMEENISRTRLLGPEKNEKNLSVISQTELSHVLKASSQVGCCASQETYIKYWSCITENIPHKKLPGSNHFDYLPDWIWHPFLHLIQSRGTFRRYFLSFQPL